MTCTGVSIRLGVEKTEGDQDSTAREVTGLGAGKKLSISISCMKYSALVYCYIQDITTKFNAMNIEWENSI